MFRQVAKGHGGSIDGTGVISWKTRERGVASMIMADFAGFSLGNISSNPQFDFLNNLNVLNNDQSEAFNFLNTDDSDSPYNLSTFHCNYYDEIEYCKTFKSEKRLSIMSLNVQSLSAKFSDLKDFLELLSCNDSSPDIICIQETWNILDCNMFLIAGYQPPIFKCRNLSHGGGVGLYFKDGLKFQLKPQSIFIEKVFESLFADVWLNGKKFTVGSIYQTCGHHPSLTQAEQFTQFLELFSNTVEEFASLSSELLIAGDFNLDVLKYQTCHSTSSYIDSLFANGLIQTVLKPTRCTLNSVLCIDHFVTNFPQSKFETCILTAKISDHFPIVFFKECSKINPKPKTVVTRDFSDQNVANFSNLLGQYGWREVLDENDPDASFNLFSNFSLPFRPTFLNLSNPDLM